MKNWTDISYKQLLALTDVLKIENDDEKVYALLEIIFGADILKLPITELNAKIKELSFLSTKMPTDLTVKNVTVNGRKYYFDGLLGKITTALYIDFLKFIKDDENKCFAVFFIPEGHKYNDGYDMEQVFNDIMDIPAPILMSASFFFQRLLETFTRIFQRYLIRDVKKQKLPKNLKMNLEQLIMNSLSSESYRMFSNSVK